jgi:beta-galactosidase
VLLLRLLLLRLRRRLLLNCHARVQTAEMDLGGVPYWMLTKNVTTIRSLDPVWQRYEQRYFSKLLPLITPLQYPRGPVVCVQIGDDSDVSILTPSYYQYQHDEFRKLGYTGLMNTLMNPGASGWWGNWAQADKLKINGSDVFAGLEFASNNALSVATLNHSFTFTRQQFPTHNPLVDFEYYPGWIDLEGHSHTSVLSPLCRNSIPFA